MIPRLCAALAAAFLPLLALANELHFAETPQPSLPCGTSSFFADVNGDGKLDLITMGGGVIGAAKLAAVFGNGDGTFDGICHPMSDPIVSKILAIADVNGDGIADVIAEQEESPVTLLVFRGRGDGTLSQPESIAFTERIDAVTVGDVNGDGPPDIVTLCWTYSPTRLRILVNGGTSFSPWKDYPSIGPRAAALADVNGDGKVDLVVAGTWNRMQSVRYYAGRSNGTLDDAATPLADLEASDLIDLNGDHMPDVVLRGETEIKTAILSQSGGSTPLLPTAIGEGAPGAVFLDVTGDGIVDCVSVHASSGIQVYRGRGDGNFEPLPPLAGPNVYNGLFYAGFAAGDFNGDGKVDLAATDGFFAGNGDGTFRAPALLLSRDAHGKSGQTVAAVAADMTNDGRPDVVLISALLEAAVFENVDGRHFISRGTAALDSLPAAPPRAADFDGDGNVDLVVSGPVSTIVLFGDGKGGLTASRFVSDGLVAVGVGSFTGDRRKQIVFSSEKTSQTIIVQPERDGRVTTLFAIPIRVSAAADVDGDGRTDLIESAPAEAVAFNEWPTFTYVPHPAAGSFLDIDGDGTADFIGTVAHDPFNAKALVERSRRDRTFEAPQRFITPFAPTAVADVDADGRLDLLSDSTASDPGIVYVNRGDGSFEATETLPNGFLAVADFDGDGRADLLVRHGNGGVIALNRPSQPGSQQAALKLSNPPCCVAYVSATSGAPSGAITLRDGDTVIGYAAVKGESGMELPNPFAPSPFEAGSHRLTASYSGDAVFAPASAETVNVVGKRGVSMQTEMIGNYVRMPVTIRVHLSDLVNGSWFGGYGGTVTVILDGKTAVVNTWTFPAAPVIELTTTLPESGDYHIATVYSGDENHSRLSLTGQLLRMYDFPLAFEKTTLTVTETSPRVYDVALTFRDASGTPITFASFQELDVQLSTTAGSLTPFDALAVLRTVRRWTLTLPNPVPPDFAAPQATLVATMSGTVIASAQIGPSPPRRRAAGH
ncbi:MAG TPA: FG-GAP-like repeat-containing protein [Thermoanaerobaculia bacterium]|nr:FG-GAP-like repeat-containing protein [Thermoanaerobaculia bacterium]